MNEDLKNIETCLPESILAEVASVPTDPQFRSLVNESLDPLKQQAVQQAGSDAYNEVVASHQPYTFTSSVRQMKSNLILLLRRLWRFPFGSGTLRSLSDAAPRSLADMWQHYITRLSGNETYGIPSRLAQLTDLPSAPLLLSDRTISGVPEAEDGESILQVLNRRAEITEIQDDNSYTMTINPLTYFANVEKLQMGCSEMNFSGGLNTPYMESAKVEELDCPNLETITDSGTYNVYSGVFRLSALTAVNLPKLRSTTGCLFYGGAAAEEVNLPSLVYAGRGVAQGVSGMKRLLCPELTTCDGYSYNPNLLNGCPDLEYAYIPKLSNLNRYGASEGAGTLQNLPKLEHLVIGAYPFKQNDTYLKYCLQGCSSLVRLELVGDLNSNIYLNSWSPTLDSSNLQQFLTNFRSYIVLRLANRKSTTALTLTLSAAVYNAVTGANSGWASQHTLADLGITTADLTDLETELGFNPAETTYASWLANYRGVNGINWNIETPQ